MDRIMLINAIQLTDDSVGRRIKFDTVAAWEYHAMKFGVDFGDKITVVGRVEIVQRGTQMTGRSWVKVTMVMVDSDGEEWRTQFTLGSHNRFEYVDDEDGDDSEPKCAAPWGCDGVPEWTALDIDGESKINVCEPCSHSTRFWGVWPGVDGGRTVESSDAGFMEYDPEPDSEDDSDVIDGEVIEVIDYDYPESMIVNPLSEAELDAIASGNAGHLDWWEDSAPVTVAPNQPFGGAFPVGACRECLIGDVWSHEGADSVCDPCYAEAVAEITHYYGETAPPEARV